MYKLTAALFASTTLASFNDNRTPLSVPSSNGYTAAPSVGGGYGGTPGNKFTCTVRSGTNAHRASKGRAPLLGDQRLDASAMVECLNMASLHVLEHTTYGSNPGSRIQAAGYNWMAVAENIYSENGYGSADPQRAVDGWIKSPGHEANMIGDYTHHGSAFCSGSDGTIYWAQDFGKGDIQAGDEYDCGVASGNVPAQQQQPKAPLLYNAQPVAPYVAPPPQKQQQPMAPLLYNAQPVAPYVAPPPQKQPNAVPASQQAPLAPASYVQPATPITNTIPESQQSPATVVLPVAAGTYAQTQPQPATPSSNVIADNQVRYGASGRPCKATGYGNKSLGQKGQRSGNLKKRGALKKSVAKRSN